MNFAVLHNRNKHFVGTTGLIYFGESTVLSYTRDNNTTSYPKHVDLAGGARDGKESPFGTFKRELDEEFGLEVTPDQIVYTKAYPGLIEPSKIGFFVVGRLCESQIDQIQFGDEGESYQLTTTQELLDNPLLIPRRKEQIETYMAHVASAASAQRL